MAETPKNNIEKLLSDYAEARRKAAGTPELHPATRRVLQSEVKQQFGAANGSTTRAEKKGWFSLWPRIAVACGVAVAVTVVVLAIIPPGKQSRPLELAQMEKAVPAAAQPLAPAPASGPKPARLMAADERTTVPDTSRVAAKMESAANAVTASGTLGYAAVSENVAARSAPGASGMELADSMASSGGRMDDGANVREAKADEMNSPRAVGLAATSPRKSLALGGKESPAPSLNAMPMASVASREDIADRLLANSSTQRFRNVAMKEGTKAKSAEIVVLDEFVVQQNGNALKIVDRDGSVYDGYVQSASGEATGTNWHYFFADKRAKAEAPTEESPATVVSASSATAGSVRRDAGSEQQSTDAQNLFFRVEGTNRSLQQRVVFTGNLIQNSFIEAGQNRFANTQAYRQQNQFQAPAAQNLGQMQMQNNFINGRVQLNNNNTATELNAVSVEP